MSGLDITGAAKSFGSTSVLHGIDLAVPDGTLGALLGPSGCGKTTLLRLVAGFERADSGSVVVGDRTLARGRGLHVRPEQRGIGIVPQEGSLFPHLSVARNAAFGLRGSLRGGLKGGLGGKSVRRNRAAEVLELVGLAGYENRMPHELSGGQQQRVALARALAPEPSLILLDEPFNALDPALRAGLREEVRQVLRTAGVTGLLVTHDPQEALSTADQVALMREGVIVQTGAPRTVYEQPNDAGLAGYLGETVVIPGTLRSGRVESALGELTPFAATARHTAEGDGSVVLRPERIVFSADDEHPDPGTSGPGVPARVAEVTFAGHDSLVYLAVDGSETRVKARSHRHPAPEVDARVRVRVQGKIAFFTGADADTHGWDAGKIVRPVASAHG